MDLIDVFGIEFNNNSEKVDQISFLKLGRRKIRVKIAGFPLLMVEKRWKGEKQTNENENESETDSDGNVFPFFLCWGMRNLGREKKMGYRR